jgi:hypothetical protein
MKKYYYVELSSQFIYDEDKKIIVNSIKELKQYAKDLIHGYLRDFFNFKKRPINEDTPDIYKNIERIYKKIYRNPVCRGDIPNQKIIGTSFTIEYRVKDTEEIEDLLSVWCIKIPKKDLMQYAGFKQIE